MSPRLSPLESLVVAQLGGQHWVAACDLAGHAVALRAPAPGGAEGLGAVHTWKWLPYDDGR